MKAILISAVLATIALSFPISAHAFDLSKLSGTFSSEETNFVTVKRLTFTAEKDGSLKVHGVLVGFPTEVSIGDTTAEPYAERNDKAHPDVLVASFSSEKSKALVVIQPYDENNTRIACTCYARDGNGSQIHTHVELKREP